MCPPQLSLLTISPAVLQPLASVLQLPKTVTTMRAVPPSAAVLLALILPQVGVWLCGFGASVSSPGALKLIASSPLPRFPPSPNRACPCASSPINTQVYAQIKYFLPDPVANDVKYQASAQPFLVFGLLTTGLAVGAHNSGAGAAVAAELLGGATGSGLL